MTEGGGYRGEEIFRLLVESVLDYAIFALDAEGRVSTWNEGAQRIKGYAEAEIVGRHFSVFYSEEDRRAGKPEQELRAAAAEGRTEDEGFRVRRDGSVFWANVVITALRNPAGQVVGFAKVTRDLTEQRRARAELEARGALLSEAQRIAQMGSWEWDLSSNRVRWSDELYRIYGVDPATFTVDLAAFLNGVHPEDRAATSAQIARARTAVEPFDFEKRIVRPDGSVRTLRSRGRPVLGPRGDVARMVGYCVDVTEEKLQRQRERELALEQAARAAAQADAERFRLLAEASERLAASLQYQATLDTFAGLAVPGLADWCAVDFRADEGGPVERAVASVDAQPCAAPDASARASAERIERSTIFDDLSDAALAHAAEQAEYLRALRAAGLRAAILCPLRSGAQSLGLLTVAFGVSGRRYEALDLAVAEELARRGIAALERARLVASIEKSNKRLTAQAEELEVQTEELQQAMDMYEATNLALLTANEELALQTQEAHRARGAAEAANRSKSEFLASMSHELRTPLNAIAGYAQLLELGVYGPVAERQLQAIQRIQRNQRHLLGLINDILNFVKLEAGQVHLEVTDVCVADALREMEALVEPQVRSRGLMYSWQAPDAALRVRADRERLDQVLLNLLSNAVKFTAPGGQISVRSESDECRVHLHVMDTGMGIPEDKRELIFEPFVQIGTGTRRAESEGVGLGLAISRDLVRAMGGDLTVVSEVGRGSTFTLTLPRAGAAPSKLEAAESSDRQ